MDDNKKIPGIEVIAMCGLTFASLNSICTTYVIIRTLTRWWITKRSLSMALRVPFYIAISDLTLCGMHISNLLYSLLHGRPWPEDDCRIIGGMTFFFVSCNMTLVGSLALLTYLRICKKWYIDLGKYDYKLFISILLLSFSFTMVGIPSFGASKYWCYTNRSNPIMPIITLSLNFSILLVAVFCYHMTLREINSIGFKQSNGQKHDTVASKTRRIEPAVVRKIIGYILIFILQWTPPMIYVFGQIINYDDIWIYIVTDTTINMGGVGNMIQYVLNEGWRDNYLLSTLNSDDFSNANSSQSPSKRHQSRITVEEVITIQVEGSRPSSPTPNFPMEELDKILIRHNDNVIRYGDDVVRQAETMLHRDQSIKSIESDISTGHVSSTESRSTTKCLLKRDEGSGSTEEEEEEKQETSKTSPLV